MSGLRIEFFNTIGRFQALVIGSSRPEAAIAFYTDLMTKLIIRSKALEDVAVIEAVTESAFFDAPHTNHNEQFILAALRDACALTVSLVAEMDGDRKSTRLNSSH